MVDPLNRGRSSQPSPTEAIRPTPAVITKVHDTLPPVVVVPAHPTPEGVKVDIIRISTGAMAAVAFTNVQNLVDRLGRFQPWMMLPSAALVQMAAARSVTSVLLDPAPGVCAPQWSGSRIRTLSGALNGRV